MRKIRVKKHKRRKRKGGASIVRSHLRKLKATAVKYEGWPERYKTERFADPEETYDPRDKPELSTDLISYKPETIQRDIMPKHLRPTAKPKMAAIDWHTLGVEPRFFRMDLPESREVLANNIYRNIKTFIEKYNLSIDVRQAAFERAMKNYDMLPIGTRFRNFDIVAAVAFYLETLERHIFIPYTDFKRDESINEKHFADELTYILQLQPDLYRKLKSRSFRFKRIRNILLGLKNELNLPDNFYKIAGDNLKRNFKVLSNAKDVLVAGILFDHYYRKNLKSTRHIHGIHLGDGAEFLGIEQSAMKIRKERMAEGLRLRQPKEIDDILKELWHLF